MTLRQQQSEFLVTVSKLIRFATLTGIKVFVNEWYRTPERQAELVKAGKSWILNSKHIKGLAVDLIILKDNGGVSWDNADYEPLGEYWEKIGGEWGGRWKVVDSVHFQYKGG